MPLESPLVFYPRYFGEVVSKHLSIAGLAWRLHTFTKRLDKDPATKNYTDVALTTDDDTVDLRELETMNLTQIAVAR